MKSTKEKYYEIVNEYSFVAHKRFSSKKHFRQDHFPVYCKTKAVNDILDIDVLQKLTPIAMDEGLVTRWRHLQCFIAYHRWYREVKWGKASLVAKIFQQRR